MCHDENRPLDDSPLPSFRANARALGTQHKAEGRTAMTQREVLTHFMDDLIGGAQAHYALILVTDGNTAGDMTKRRDDYAQACARECLAGYDAGYKAAPEQHATAG